MASSATTRQRGSSTPSQRTRTRFGSASFVTRKLVAVLARQQQAGGREAGIADQLQDRLLRVAPAEQRRRLLVEELGERPVLGQHIGRDGERRVGGELVGKRADHVLERIVVECEG